MFYGQMRKRRTMKDDEIVDAVPDPQIQYRKCVEYLPCKFSQEEIIEMSQEQARTYQDLQEFENRKKEVMADLTADIKKREAALGLLARKINSGYEYRNVDCEWILDFWNMTKTLTRLDLETDFGVHVVRTAPLSSADQQASLELAEAALPKNQAGPDAVESSGEESQP